MKKALSLFEFTPNVAEVEINWKSKTKPCEREKISNSADCYKILRALWPETIEYRETFFCLLLNKANEILGAFKTSEGSTDGTVVDPKMIFQSALLTNARGIILAHNHPSGNLKPSEADRKLTRQLQEAGKVLEIAVLDHLIITSENYYSFADEGMM